MTEHRRFASRDPLPELCSTALSICNMPKHGTYNISMLPAR